MNLEKFYEYAYQLLPCKDTFFQIVNAIGILGLPIFIWYMSAFHSERKKKAEHDIIILNSVFASHRICAAYFYDSIATKYLKALTDIRGAMRILCYAEKSNEQIDYVENIRKSASAEILLISSLKYTPNEIIFISKYDPRLYLNLLKLLDCIQIFHDTIRAENEYNRIAINAFLNATKVGSETMLSDSDLANSNYVRQARSVRANLDENLFKIELLKLEQKKQEVIENARLEFFNSPEYVNAAFTLFERDVSKFRNILFLSHEILALISKTFPDLLKISNEKFKSRVDLADKEVIDYLMKNIAPQIKNIETEFGESAPWN